MMRSLRVWDWGRRQAPRSERLARRRILELAETSPHLLADLGFELDHQSAMVSRWTSPGFDIVIEHGTEPTSLHIRR